jgi:hypothetical protein
MPLESNNVVNLKQEYDILMERGCHHHRQSGRAHLDSHNHVRSFSCSLDLDGCHEQGPRWPVHQVVRPVRPVPRLRHWLQVQEVADADHPAAPVAARPRRRRRCSRRHPPPVQVRLFHPLSRRLRCRSRHPGLARPSQAVVAVNVRRSVRCKSHLNVPLTSRPQPPHILLLKLLARRPPLPQTRPRHSQILVLLAPPPVR